MFDSIVLDVIIGLVFIYLLYSLLASILQEMIATNLGFRAKVLEKAILRMLHDDKETSKILSRFTSWKHLLLSYDWLKDKPAAAAFYNHGLIKYLSEDKWHKRPSYISAKNFSKVLIDLMRGFDPKAGEDFRIKVEAALASGKIDISTPSNPNQYFTIDEGTLIYIRSLWADAQGDIEKFKTSLENWFDDMMKRASGWYKRYIQLVLFVIGFGMAVIFNIDTLQIVDKLSKDPILRAQVIQQSSLYLKENTSLKSQIEILKKKNSTNNDTIQAVVSLETLIQKNDSLIKAANLMVSSDIKKVNNILGLGWEKKKEYKKWSINYKLDGKPFGFSVLLGWILTAVAISMGAPFWFDLLNKLMKLKGSGSSSDTATIKSTPPSPVVIQPKG